MSRAAFYRTEELDEVVSRMARQACGLVPDPAPQVAGRCVLLVDDVHVPPYEIGFEIHVNRREAGDVQEP